MQHYTIIGKARSIKSDSGYNLKLSTSNKRYVSKLDLQVYAISIIALDSIELDLPRYRQIGRRATERVCQARTMRPP